MKEKSSLLFLCLAGAFCFIICILTGYTAVNNGTPGFFSPSENHQEQNGQAVESEKKKNEGVSVSSPVNTSSAPKTVETAVKADAIGKIKEQFFGNAGINSNNVQINNKTSVSINVCEFLKTTLPFKIEPALPQVLIVHTHTTESYMPSDRDFYTATDLTHSQKETENVVAVGRVFAEKLKAANIQVIHSKTIHDYPSYSGSYDKCAETINKILKENPSIKVVIDLHRDSISDGNGGKIKPVVKIGGKKAAQVMLVLGNNFDGWKNNFALAVKFHQTMQVMYPGLTRPISLYNKKYNQNLSSGAFILEVGTDANSLEEALYAAELSANALVGLLNTLK